MSFRHALLSLSLVVAVVPVAAQQQSEGYKFLEAVRSANANVVIDMLGKPGSNIINTKDRTNGDGALHVVVKTDNSRFMEYLLQQKADPNMRDGRNNTPLILAAQLGKSDLIPILLTYRANPNLANAAGETALIVAVQHRDVETTRLLLDKGANPDQTDNVAGMSARDYAARDARNPELAKLLAAQPKQAKRAVAGPKL